MDSCVRPGAEDGNSCTVVLMSYLVNMSSGLFTFSKGNTLGPRLATVMRQEVKGKGRVK